MMWEGDEAAELSHLVAVAGEFTTNTGMPLDVKSTRIKHSASNSDVDKEGVRLEMTGSRDPFTPPKGGQKGVKQKANIELLCNHDKTGWEPGKDPKGEKKSRKRDDGDEEEHEKQDEAAAITFLNYDREIIDGENWDVLRLSWETKWACEDAAENMPQTEGWGFFTWVILL
jgi:autophagy-related protein 27